MLKYSFVVENVKEIDVVRISKENKETEALAITFENTDMALLMLSKAFLRGFCTDDICISGNPLSPLWGEDIWTFDSHSGKVNFYALSEKIAGSLPRLQYHRATNIKTNQINNIIDEIINARSRKCTVKVNVHKL